MLRFYCFLTGDQYTMLVEDTPKSKQKVMLMANALLVPVITWAINGYLLAYQVFETSVVIAIITSLICAFLIFLVERIIIMATSDPGMKRFRIVLGICAAFLGSLALDEVVFKKDIDHQLTRNKETYAENRAQEEGQKFDSINLMTFKLQTLNKAKDDLDAAYQTVIIEMDGKGSGTKGVGKITAEKKGIADKREKDLAHHQTSYDSLLVAKALAMSKVKEEAKSEYNNGLIIRIGAMFQLVFGNILMFLAYLAFTILMFCLEFIVVWVKLKTPESNYERRVKLIEEIGEKRMRILSGEASPLADPAYCLPNALKARQAVNKSNSLYN